MNSAVLETLQTYRARKNPVNANIPQNFHQISTPGKTIQDCGQKAQGLKPCFPARGSMAFRPKKRANSAHAEAEDKKLRKDLLEVLALKVPFRNLLVFPNRAPWPGRLRTSSSLSLIRCQTRTRVAKTASGEPHSLGSLFIADEYQKAQAGNKKATQRFARKVRAVEIPLAVDHLADRTGGFDLMVWGSGTRRHQRRCEHDSLAKSL